MSYPMRLLVIPLIFFLAPPVGAEDKPPAKPADARRAALVRAGYTPVPLALDPRHLSFSADGTVGSEKVKFDLDSGSFATLLDLKLAKRLKLELGAEVATTGLDGRLVSRPTRIPGLKIGPYDTHKDWPHLPVLAADLSGQPGGLGGVLGMGGMLDTWGAVVDFPARSLYMRPLLTTAVAVLSVEVGFPTLVGIEY